VADGDGEVVQLTAAWRERTTALADYTDTRSEINRQRYCTYIAEEGEAGCGLCVRYCPSGAVGNSAPQPTGAYAEAVQGQASRFGEGHLQFDFAACLEDRSPKAKLYPDYVCARCVAICAAEGTRRAS
jgi:ferredoxin